MSERPWRCEEHVNPRRVTHIDCAKERDVKWLAGSRVKEGDLTSEKTLEVGSCSSEQKGTAAFTRVSGY